VSEVGAGQVLSNFRALGSDKFAQVGREGGKEEGREGGATSPLVYPMIVFKRTLASPRFSLSFPSRHLPIHSPLCHPSLPPSLPHSLPPQEFLGRSTKVGDIDLAKTNLHGGSLSLGHPFAATGKEGGREGRREEGREI